MQLVPSHSLMMNMEQIVNFMNPLGGYKGPGIYYQYGTTEEFIIVIPNPPEDDPTPDGLWYVRQPEGTMFDLHFYNVPLNKTVLGHAHRAPLRNG